MVSGFLDEISLLRCDWLGFVGMLVGSGAIRDAVDVDLERGGNASELEFAEEVVILVLPSMAWVRMVGWSPTVVEKVPTGQNDKGFFDFH